MLLTTTTFICTDATGPKFWLAWSNADSITRDSYGYAIVGIHISTGQNYLEVFDTELELSNRVNTLKGIDDWYDTCENRVLHQPGIVEWECIDGTPNPAVQ